MVYCEKNNFRFDSPSYVSFLNKMQKDKLIETEESSEIKFVAKPDLSSNKEKQIYKVGFLSEFLKLLYPEKNFAAICQIMSDRYDVYIERRQIDRLTKKYKEDNKFQ